MTAFTRRLALASVVAFGSAIAVTSSASAANWHCYWSDENNATSGPGCSRTATLFGRLGSTGWHNVNGTNRSQRQAKVGIFTNSHTDWLNVRRSYGGTITDDLLIASPALTTYYLPTSGPTASPYPRRNIVFIDALANANAWITIATSTLY